MNPVVKNDIVLRIKLGTLCGVDIINFGNLKMTMNEVQMSFSTTG